MRLSRLDRFGAIEFLLVFLVVFIYFLNFFLKKDPSGILKITFLDVTRRTLSNYAKKSPKKILRKFWITRTLHIIYWFILHVYFYSKRNGFSSEENCCNMEKCNGRRLTINRKKRLSNIWRVFIMKGSIIIHTWHLARLSCSTLCE